MNIRLITATNSDLLRAVDEGQFRKDLLYRINTIEIAIPPLRERPEDIIPLANSFLQRAAGKYAAKAKTISVDAQRVLEAYDWPGNVRELGHVMERAQILSQSDSITSRDLGIDSSQVSNALTEHNTQDAAPDLRAFDAIERDVVRQRMQYFGGDASRAAESLGWSRATFYRKLDKSKDPL